MPTPIKFILLTLMLLALVPPALIAQARESKSNKPRVHFVQDMDNQPKYRAQAANEIFADGRAMRPPVAGTVARGELWEDDLKFRGIAPTPTPAPGAGAGAGQWAAAFPPDYSLDMEFLQRGQDRFNIYCSPCHGYAGYGDGTVNKRGTELTIQGINGSSWVEAKSLHEATIRAQPPGQIYNSITNGIRTMSGYASQVPVDDRWAIVAYVKALQRSQNPN